MLSPRGQDRRWSVEQAVGVGGGQHSQMLEDWWEPERKRFQQACGSEKGWLCVLCGEWCGRGSRTGDQEEWPSDDFCRHSQEYRAKNKGGQIAFSWDSCFY